MWCSDEVSPVVGDVGDVHMGVDGAGVGCEFAEFRHEGVGGNGVEVPGEGDQVGAVGGDDLDGDVGEVVIVVGRARDAGGGAVGDGVGQLSPTTRRQAGRNTESWRVAVGHSLSVPTRTEFLLQAIALMIRVFVSWVDKRLCRASVVALGGCL